MESKKNASQQNWADFYAKTGNQLTDEQRRIVAMLSAGKTQREIATELGLHRSGVYHKIRKLRTML